MTAQDQMTAKGIAIGDYCWVYYQGCGCLGIVHGFTPKRVLVENLGRNVDGAQPYAPANVQFRATSNSLPTDWVL